MKTGKLEINFDERFYILFDDGEECNALHCGEVIELEINGEFKEGRVEHNGDDYVFLYEDKTRLMTEGARARI